MKLVRSLLLAVLLSMLFGFAIGTVIRLRLERPVRYIGSLADPEAGADRTAGDGPLARAAFL